MRTATASRTPRKPQAGQDALGASDISDVLSLAEAARLVPGGRSGSRGVHVVTLHRWAASGILRVWRAPNGIMVTTRLALLAATGVPVNGGPAMRRDHAAVESPKSVGELDSELDAVLGKKKTFTTGRREGLGARGLGPGIKTQDPRPKTRDSSRQPITNGGAA